MSLIDSTQSAVEPATVTRWRHQKFAVSKDFLTIESPLQICINHLPFSVTMRTPGHDFFLARGLLFTEGIIPEEQILLGYQQPVCQEFEVPQSIQIFPPSGYRPHLEQSERAIQSNSSCGLCGKVRLSDITIEKQPLTPRQPLVGSLIMPMLEKMGSLQKNFNLSGGTHAAAAFADDGTLLEAFEDIGRHNAVDKVIGALLENQTLAKAHALTVSGRISYEIVTKAYRAKIPFLIAVSAASSLAVSMAVERGMTLIGFARKEQFTIYSHPENVMDRGRDDPT